MSESAPESAPDDVPESAPDPDPEIEVLAAAYAAQAESTSTHPVSPTPVVQLRAALARAFTDGLEELGELAGGTAPVVEESSGRDEVPASEPGQPGTVEVSATRTAGAAGARLVLHETSTLDADGRERRTTIALTGSSADGERFWLGATSYDAGPVERLELVGDLPAFAAPLLGRVLITLRGGPVG